jgi:eukaryotic-like serine/threonine-protein kinase
MADYAGHQLGNYRLRRLLGRGGSADVYLGEHIYLETLAAVKVLNVQIGSVELVDFRREAKIIAHLLNPHILRVLDFGVEDNVPFLVMDYAPNGTLRQCYPKGTRLQLPAIIFYVTQIAQALQYAHDRKVIHRDVKPENMLLGLNDQVLLSDFGISAIEQSTNMLITHQRVATSPTGTVYYMAPEQIHGDLHPSIDQYALGIVVYEWLCGSRPFAGDALAAMYQHVHVPPPSLREKIPTISPAVEGVVLKALAKDPRQRFARIQDFAEALAQESQAREEPALTTQSPFRQPAPMSAQGDGPAQGPATLPSPRPPSRPPDQLKAAGPARGRSLPGGIAMLLLALALVLAAGGAAFFLSLSKKASNATIALNTPLTVVNHGHASTTPATTNSVYDNAVNASGVMFGFDAQHSHVNPFERILSAANVHLLVQAWQFSSGGSIGSVPTAANGIVYFSSSDGEMYALSAATGRVLWTKGIGSYDFGCAPTVDRGVVYMGGPEGLYALDARTGGMRWFLPTGRIGSSPTLVNGVLYVGTDDGNLYAIDAVRGKRLWSFPTGGIIRSSPAVVRGVVYTGSRDDNLYAIDAVRGKRLWSFPTGGKIDSSPAVARGVVYAGSGDGKLYAVDAVTGKRLWSFPTDGSIDSSPAVANGEVYAASQGGKLYVFDSARGALLWTASIGGGSDSSPAIANGVLYIGSTDHRLYAFNASGCGRASCSSLWTDTTGNFVRSSPTVANGYVYVGSDDHRLYAFHLLV